jgi:hypothetical protein
VLEEGCAAATQVAIAIRRDDVCRPQFPKPVRLWLPRKHLVDGHQYLIRLQFRPQVAEILHRAGRIGSACRQHAFPIRPRDSIRWTHLLRCQGRIHCDVQFFGPPSPSPGLVVGHEVQGHRRQIISLEQCGDFPLLCQANDLPMGAHEAANRGLGQHVRLVRLPAEQTGHGCKRQLLRQQTGPFLQATGDNDAVVGWQHTIAGYDVGLHGWVVADLTRELQGAEAARNSDRLSTVGVDDGGGKNTGDAARPVWHQSCPIALGARA